MTERQGYSPGTSNYNIELGDLQSAMVGPRTGQGMNAFNSLVSYYENMGWLISNPVPAWSSGSPGSPSTNDMFYINSDPVTQYCWVQPGTNNVTGLAEVGYCSPNGGSSGCGGGGYGN